MGGLSRTQRLRPPPREGDRGTGPASSCPGGLAGERRWALARGGRRRRSRDAGPAVSCIPRRSCGPASGPGPCFVLSVLCTLGDTASLGLVPLRPHPGLRLKTPPSVVTHWLMGDGGPRREGPVAAVLEAQVWRAPGSPQMRNRNFFMVSDLGHCSYSVLKTDCQYRRLGKPP